MEHIPKEGSSRLLMMSGEQMQPNIVTLGDDEYDAVAGPLVSEACELVVRLGGSRAYMLPVVIAVLRKYVQTPQIDELPSVPLSAPCRPHFRIHMGED